MEQDLRSCSPRTVQRELLRTMVQNQTANEVPREVGLGPDYFYDTEDQAVNRLMAQLDSKEDGCSKCTIKSSNNALLPSICSTFLSFSCWNAYCGNFRRDHSNIPANTCVLCLIVTSLCAYIIRRRLRTVPQVLDEPRLHCQRAVVSAGAQNHSSPARVGPAARAPRRIGRLLDRAQQASRGHEPPLRPQQQPRLHHPRPAGNLAPSGRDQSGRSRNSKFHVLCARAPERWVWRALR